jgi:hypothetical protein
LLQHYFKPKRSKYRGSDFNKPDEDTVYKEIREQYTGTAYEPIINKESLFRDRYKKFKMNNTIIIRRGIRSDILKTDFKDERYEQFKDEVNDKMTEIQVCQNILDQQLSLLHNNENIPSMKMNIVVLFIFSIIGVFVPLGMLLFDRDTMIEWRAFIFILILLAWFGVVWSIFREIWKLLDHDIKNKKA